MGREAVLDRPASYTLNVRQPYPVKLVEITIVTRSISFVVLEGQLRLFAVRFIINNQKEYNISDLAHSTYNLSDIGSSETEEKKKSQQKKKSNRISRVIEEFISMGDAISYADKRLSKYDLISSVVPRVVIMSTFFKEGRACPVSTYVHILF